MLNLILNSILQANSLSSELITSNLFHQPCLNIDRGLTEDLM